MQSKLHFPGHSPDFFTQLSACAYIGNDMWVGADEGQGIARLQSIDNGASWEADALSSLAGILDLPASGGEIDLEGMDWDAVGGYLWAIGSHSLKRKNPIKDPGDPPKLGRLKTVEADANRFIFARIPMKIENGQSRLAVPTEFTSSWYPAQFECAVPEKFRNALYDALRLDPYFARFVQRLQHQDGGDQVDDLGIPGKDNGLDIEGLAFAGMTPDGAARLFVGLRGPVLRGWAAVLEVRLSVQSPSATKAGRFSLQPIGSNGQLYRRVFLQLDGLGIRDFCFHGDDLLILAGPTMVLDWPVSVYRWFGARALEDQDRILDQKSAVLEQVDVQGLSTPAGEKGKNRAEGIAIFPFGTPAGKVLSILYDAPGPSLLADGPENTRFDLGTIA